MDTIEVAKKISYDGRVFPDYVLLHSCSVHKAGTAVLPPTAMEKQTALCEELKRCANKLGRPKAYVSLLVFN